ncbi:3744_t:CDS:2, partial [Gigaspora rosea]
EGYKILPEDCRNRSWMCKGDVKTITLVDEYAKELFKSKFAYIEYLGCSTWKGHILVLQDKPLNLCNLEYHENHDLDYIRKKPLQISNSVRKTITKRVANTTPSMLASNFNLIILFSQFLNNSKILDTTINTPANQVQPTSTRFTPNLESIQNALKYDKKLYHPSISEFEK